MIYAEINKYMFIDEMIKLREKQLSYSALSAIYEYLEDISEDYNIELDPIAIFCEFTEYENKEEAAKDLGCVNTDELESCNDILETDENTIVVLNY